MTGTIIKGIAGFYYVKTDHGLYECRARGIFKNEGITPMVGDLVEIDVIGDMTGYINNIYPRKNQFIRPPISNVEQFVIVVSAQKPKLNFLILDRFLVMAEMNQTDAVIVINKQDVSKSEDIDRIMKIYDSMYPCIVLSAKKNKGIEKLMPYLRDRSSALAGTSGVGKTTLLNRLQDDFNEETGDISKKTGRGKNTTRHVEIFELEQGGKVFDTPGFTSFDILECDESMLEKCYPEMYNIEGNCRYDDCRHVNEPECMIRRAVEKEIISESRYKSYLTQIKEIRERRIY